MCRPLSFRVLAACTCLIAAPGLLAPRRAAAQDRPRQTLENARLDSVTRKVDSMAPISGPPGTTVRLHSRNMPALTPLRIGVGAVRFGFEEVGQVLTDEKGEFSMTVTVPSWARKDLSHRFIIFDFYFVPIALSDAFYVTDSTGTLAREGEVVSVGRCPTLRGDDSVLYPLAGDVQGLKKGARVVVEGKLIEASACAREATIEVARVKAAKGR